MSVFLCTQFPESLSVDTRRSFRRGGFCWSCDYHIYLEKCRKIVQSDVSRGFLCVEAVGFTRFSIGLWEAEKLAVWHDDPQ